MALPSHFPEDVSSARTGLTDPVHWLPSPCPIYIHQRGGKINACPAYTEHSLQSSLKITLKLIPLTGACVHAKSLQSCPFVTPWTTARQAPLSMGFPRQEYRSGLPFPTPGLLPNRETEHSSPAWQANSGPLSHLGSPHTHWDDISKKQENSKCW